MEINKLKALVKLARVKPDKLTKAELKQVAALKAKVKKAGYQKPGNYLRSKEKIEARRLDQEIKKTKEQLRELEDQRDQLESERDKKAREQREREIEEITIELEPRTRASYLIQWLGSQWSLELDTITERTSADNPLQGYASSYLIKYGVLRDSENEDDISETLPFVSDDYTLNQIFFDSMPFGYVSALSINAMILDDREDTIEQGYWVNVTHSVYSPYVLAAAINSWLKEVQKNVADSHGRFLAALSVSCFYRTTESLNKAKRKGKKKK